jgi:CubicO group peptidase (beta-lactamase class C family)
MAHSQSVAGAPEPTPSEREAMADLGHAFMEQHDIPALSVAIGRAGRIVYREALGWADLEGHEELTPDHLFRIASVSKPITSATIFSLSEAGRLQPVDRVFGPGAVLGTDFGRPPYHPHVEQITIEHLLTHTGGGWENDEHDPMFAYPQLDQARLIERILRERPLDHVPGQAYAYSNFGYCLLGRVIEKIARQPYEVHVREALLKRCGVNDMTIAGNTLAQRFPGEVKYYDRDGDPYGMNVARMDSHGGWIARPSEVVQFVMHVDGFAAQRNILKPPTIRTMTTPSAANPRYAKGWEVNADGNWWHGGSLPGSATTAARIHSGLCWAAFVNTGGLNSSLGSDLEGLVWDMAGEVKRWRT